MHELVLLSAMHHGKKRPPKPRQEGLELTARRQPFIWGVQRKQREEGIVVEKQTCPTCSHSPNDGSISFLAVHQDSEAVSVLHSRGQARDYNAARIRDDFSGSLSTLAWTHTQLQRSRTFHFKSQIHLSQLTISILAYHLT